MNPTQSVAIEIVSDVVCPWCFIGLRRLDVALEFVRRGHPDIHCTKRWRPFFLNPNASQDGEPYLPHLVRKFGGIERVQAAFQHVRDVGGAYGIDYRFEDINVLASTFQAHRLVHWAQQQGDAQSLVERLLVGQFQRGENLGDKAVLVSIAVECGYSEAALSGYLDSDADSVEVRHLEMESRSWGVTAVPTFIIERKLMVAGAEDPVLLADAIEQVLAMPS